MGTFFGDRLAASDIGKRLATSSIGERLTPDNYEEILAVALTLFKISDSLTLIGGGTGEPHYVRIQLFDGNEEDNNERLRALLMKYDVLYKLVIDDRVQRQFIDFEYGQNPIIDAAAQVLAAEYKMAVLRNEQLKQLNSEREREEQLKNALKQHAVKQLQKMIKSINKGYDTKTGEPRLFLELYDEDSCDNAQALFETCGIQVEQCKRLEPRPSGFFGLKMKKELSCSLDVFESKEKSAIILELLSTPPFEHQNQNMGNNMGSEYGSR